MGRIFGFYSWNPVLSFYLGHTSSKGAVNLYYYYYFSFIFWRPSYLEKLVVLKVHFYLLLSFFTYFSSPSWGLSLHEVIYIKLVLINRLVRSLQTISWFDTEYLQKKNKLTERGGCVYTKVQSNCCTFIAYIMRIILIMETMLYQISGLFGTPGVL